jgi:hypothetical protein
MYNISIVLGGLIPQRRRHIKEDPRIEEIGHESEQDENLISRASSSSLSGDVPNNRPDEIINFA